MRFQTPHALSLVTCLVLAPSLAQADEGPPSEYWNPRGAIVLSPVIGIGVAPGHTVVEVGVSVGYAVLTGVLPAIQGVFISDSVAGVGGQVGTTLTLTPPINFFLTPFVRPEAARQFGADGNGWLYGVGVGAYVGTPESRFGVQAGWVFRRIAYDDLHVDARDGMMKKGFDASGPLIALSVRF